ncbi:phiSA1p31-related protein [Streptomyces sp. CFMR 7]|uniref:phiSA1p31-related protein n=1 Tax=Streptomyces sp. CFMR 7 TaxID=1649184 RepID=UPI0011A4DCF7|nr:phiSA1p31-related protein [Streptomyces sp. CFMR 7]
MNTTFVHEGIEFDLTLTYADCTGVEWVWTGEQVDGVPLMAQRQASHGCRAPWKLTDLYWELGPLIAIHDRPSNADFRKAIDPDYAATVAAGYVEAHIAAAVAPTPTARHLPPSPLKQTGFRGFLNSIAGGNR